MPSHHALHPGIKKQVSPSLRYELPPSSHAESRSIRSFRATSSAVYSPASNSRILIEIPRIDGTHINGNSSYLQGVFKAAGTGVMYSNSLSSFIKRLIIRGSDNTVLEDIQSYNVLHRCISDLTVPKYNQDNVLSLTAGYGDDAARTQYAQVCGPLQIEIELEEDANVLQTSDGSPATFAISDVRLTLELMQFSDQINQAVQSAFKQGRISLHCPTKASNLRNFSKDSLGERTIGSLVSISVQIGSQMIDSLTTESEMWMSTLRAFEYQVTGSISQKNYSTKFPDGTGTSFLIAWDLANDEGSGWVSGNSSMATIEVKMVHSNAISPDILQYDAFCLVDRVITFTPQGPQVTQ